MAAATVNAECLGSSVINKLKSLGIAHELIPHPPARTVEDLTQHFTGKAGYCITKNLFLSDKKKRYFVLSAAASANVNLRLLSAKLNAPNLRLGSDKSMSELLGIIPGAVSPLAAINDTNNCVTFLLDSMLKTVQDPILCHPLHNEASVAISTADVVDFLKAVGHDVAWVDMDAPPAEGVAELSKVTPNGVKVPDAAAATAPKATKSPVVAKLNGTTSISSTAIDGSILGLTVKKAENFSEWYTQTITKSEMIEYYDVSGCYILRPWSFYLWEQVQEFFNAEIRKIGVQNAYFPMFVSKAKLEAEKNHVEGFSPEVAWVTRYGDSDMAEPIAIRPTSETIMYPAYAKWIRSHRDLPLLLNQWCPVVRWEFKQPTPFIRTREFLWQEGHTAHATDAEAMDMVLTILQLYSRVYEELLAVPVIKGIKSEGEKFAGGKMTTTIETLIPTNGRGVQAATSHHLGTNFSKMFNIEFEDRDKKRQPVHQTSWGLTTRSLGVAVMVHGDDKGMVMPPRVAPLQAIIIPIVYKEEESSDFVDRCDVIFNELKAAGVRAKVDDRPNYTPGWKYNHWELKGVCIRLELGPKDMANQSIRAVRRDTGAKVDLPWNGLAASVVSMLAEVQQSMFMKVKKQLDESIVKVTCFDEVMPVLNARKLVMAPWSEDPESEELIKKETTRLSLEAVEASEEGGAPALTGAMKALCIPLEQAPMAEGTPCFFQSEKTAKRWCIFGRSY